MPLYTFECDCGHTVAELRILRRRDDPKPCPACETGWLRRGFDVPARPSRADGHLPARERDGSDPPGTVPNVTMRNVSFEGSGQADIHVGSGWDIDIDGLRSKGSNTVIEQEAGSRITAKNVYVDGRKPTR